MREIKIKKPKLRIKKTASFLKIELFKQILNPMFSIALVDLLLFIAMCPSGY